MIEDKNLSPEEKIKKLKELKKQKEKEIADAQKKIQENEDELSERKKFKEKVPIPESAQQDLEGLSQEGKEILKEQKGLRDNNKETSEKYDLETLAKEKIDLPPEILHSQYAQELSREPMQEIYHEMAGIHKNVEEKGYISREEEKRVEYLSSAVERKIEASETGGYSFSQDAARAASITKQLGSKMIDSYKSHSNEMYRSS